MDKNAFLCHLAFVGCMSICIIVNAIFLSRLKSDNSYYQEAVCTLDKINWIRDDRYQLFSDKTSLSNVTVTGQETFSYMIPQYCELSKYVAFIASNCPSVGAQTRCWVRWQPLNVKKTLPGDSGYVIGIMLPGMLLFFYMIMSALICWCKKKEDVQNSV